MSKAGKKMIEAADELERFARGEDIGPMTLYMPDGNGALVKREVANIEEYRAIWHQEGLRVIRAARTTPPV